MKARALILVTFSFVIVVAVISFAVVSYSAFSDIAISQQKNFIERLSAEEAERLSLMLPESAVDASLDFGRWIKFRSGQKFIDFIAKGNAVVFVPVSDEQIVSSVGLTKQQITALLNEQASSGSFYREGGLYIWSRAPIGNSDLTLLSVHYDISVVRSALSNITLRLITISLIVIWVSVWVVLMLATVISRHLDKQNRQLEYKSLHDELTGLGNRMLLQRELQRQISARGMRKQWLALLVADIDRFKEINNTLGHDVGDTILKEVAARLKAALPDDLLLMRLSSDEFGVMAMLDSMDECNRIIDIINHSLDEPLTINSDSIKVDASIGVSVYPKHSHDAGSLIRHAEIAMHSAKSSASGYAFYNSANDTHTKRKLELRNQLRSAIDNNALLLHFQPKLNLNTREFDSLEAFVRWYHPSKGMIYPEEIFSLAEHTGVSKQLSRWVLEECISFCARISANDRKFTMAVNVSTADLQQHGFTDYLADTLRKYALPPGSLILEITEASMAALGSASTVIINSITRLGVQISIDDFGTGFTSLSLLSRLPINEIKIDASLVKEFEQGSNESLIQTIIEMSHGMSCRVVAEGVESAKSLQRLQQLRCDVVQGYYLCRPIDETELKGWLNTPREEMIKVALR